MGEGQGVEGAGEMEFVERDAGTGRIHHGTVYEGSWVSLRKFHIVCCSGGRDSVMESKQFPCTLDSQIQAHWNNAMGY